MTLLRLHEVTQIQFRMSGGPHAPSRVLFGSLAEHLRFGTGCLVEISPTSGIEHADWRPDSIPRRRERNFDNWFGIERRPFDCPD